jgi:sec-independent protein translocase protein TatB
MMGLDITELMLVGVMVLLFVGPERLPEATRTLGRIYGQLRRSADELRRALTLEADRADEEHRLRQLVKRRKEAEAKRRAEAEAEAKRRAEAGEGDAGPKPQPEPGVPEAAPEAEEAIIPPGFTAEEWAELPEHVRTIVQRRVAAR